MTWLGSLGQMANAISIYVNAIQAAKYAKHTFVTACLLNLKTHESKQTG
jgi:hypothetical protein